MWFKNHKGLNINKERIPFSSSQHCTGGSSLKINKKCLRISKFKNHLLKYQKYRNFDKRNKRYNASYTENYKTFLRGITWINEEIHYSDGLETLFGKSVLLLSVDSMQFQQKCWVFWQLDSVIDICI